MDRILKMKSLEGTLIRDRRRASWWLAGIVFVALNVVLRFAIDQPPTWDGAMTVYPAAIELSRTDFDFARLLSLPTFVEGGPRTHATSPLTVLVAILITTTGSLANALPILHVISFGLASLTVAAAHRLIAHSASGIVAVVGALAVLLFPPTIVQTADIYLDLPIACLGTWGLVMLLERRFVAASGLIALAVWVKPLALTYAGVLLGFVLIYGEPGKKVSRAVALSVPPLLVAAVIAILESPASTPLPNSYHYSVALDTSAALMATMPDLLALIGAALVLAFVSAKRPVPQEASVMMLLSLISALALMFLFPLISRGYPSLPRHYVWLVPPLVAVILTFASAKSQTLAVALASIVTLAFAVNLNGVFYSHENYPYYTLAERSLAYRDLLSLQIEDVALITELSQKMPVYYDYAAFYRLEYPELGYSHGPLESGVSVFQNRMLSDVTMADLPDRFAFVFEFPILGGEILLRIWNEAKASGAKVTETALTRGPFTVYVIEVDQTGVVSP
jgi:hypothetical protein